MSLRTTIYISDASEKLLKQAEKLSKRGHSKIVADMLELGMPGFKKRYRGVKRAKPVQRKRKAAARRSIRRGRQVRRKK